MKDMRKMEQISVFADPSITDIEYLDKEEHRLGLLVPVMILSFPFCSTREQHKAEDSAAGYVEKTPSHSE